MPNLVQSSEFRVQRKDKKQSKSCKSKGFIHAPLLKKDGAGFTHAPKYGAGFTLIELLVAVSIIAVLSVIGLTTYNGVQARARDTKRIEDLKRITNYLELYYLKMKYYPSYGGGSTCEEGFTDIVAPGTSMYTVAPGTSIVDELIAQGITDNVPMDKNPVHSCSYGYFKGEIAECNNKTYAFLYAQLETESGKGDIYPSCWPSSEDPELDKKDWVIFLPE